MDHGQPHLAPAKAAMLLAAVAALALSLRAQSSDPWSATGVLEPAALARILKAPGEKPLILQVGFDSLYAQGHIPDSVYCGPARSAQGLARLKSCLAKVPKTRAIVLYCGCCPWAECPNIRPAYRALKEWGYTDVRVMHIARNFGRDWASRGYPTARR